MTQYNHHNTNKSNPKHIDGDSQHSAQNQRQKKRRRRRKHDELNELLFTVECAEQPLFRCMERQLQKGRRRRRLATSTTTNQPSKEQLMVYNDCLHKVQKEQGYVTNRIQDILLPFNIVIIRSTQRLINALYLQITILPITIIDDNNTSAATTYNTTSTSVCTTSQCFIHLFSSIDGISRVYQSTDYSSSTSNIQSVSPSSLKKRQRTIHRQQQDNGRTNEDDPNQPELPIFNHCYGTGAGIRIAILDTGIDYTHQTMGGIGTIESYQQQYSANISTFLFPTTTIIQGYDFVGDMDDTNDDEPSSLRPDPNPIDSPFGHGTAVAHAVRSIAPSAKLIAVKVCRVITAKKATSNNSSDNTYQNTTITYCPEYAIIQGLEYIIDPMMNGSFANQPHIVNLSLGQKYTSSYYSMVAKALEHVVDLFDILPIVAAGNYGNVPYIMGGEASSPNVFTVGASSTSLTDGRNTTIRTIASYTSRGPTSDGTYNSIKPNLVAPGGPYGLAAAATGNMYSTRSGSSFAAPIVAGYAALLMEHCQYDCSSFVIKTILSNSANRNIGLYESPPTANTNNATNTATGGSYTTTDTNTSFQRTPVTLGGSGEVDIQNAMNATFWVYSIQDVNPTISLGLMSVATSTTVTRTLRIVPIPLVADYDHDDALIATSTVSIHCDFRTVEDETLSAVVITIEPDVIRLNHTSDPFQRSRCSKGNNNTSYASEADTDDEEYDDDDEESSFSMNDVYVNVTFTLDASRTPTNRMTYSGSRAADASLLDFQEFDGWIVLTTVPTITEATKSNTSNNDSSSSSSSSYDTTQHRYDAVVPFHMILRKAADVHIEQSQFESFVNTNDTATKAYTIGLSNNGSDVSHIDIYELLYTSPDDIESMYGSNDPPNDIRYFGYRLVHNANSNSNSSDSNDSTNECMYMMEFAITFWEQKTTLVTTEISIHIDIDSDNVTDYVLYNAGYFQHGKPYSEGRVRNVSSDEDICSKYIPDFGTNTANVVLRVCATDIGVTGSNPIQLQILSIETSPVLVASMSDVSTKTIPISFPHAALSAPSYDVRPGERLESINVGGSGIRWDNTPALGLLLFTNGYVDANHTGASTKGTETIILSLMGSKVPIEVTPDELQFPVPHDITGPTCAWTINKKAGGGADSCPTSQRHLHTSNNSVSSRMVTFPIQCSNLMPSRFCWNDDTIIDNVLLYPTDDAVIVEDDILSILTDTCPHYDFVTHTELKTFLPLPQVPTNNPTMRASSLSSDNRETSAPSFLGAQWMTASPSIVVMPPSLNNNKSSSSSSYSYVHTNSCHVYRTFLFLILIINILMHRFL